MRVFISHSSHDRELAQVLVDLVRNALKDLEETEIRCTSVDGYGLPAGLPADETLRIEVHQAALVIGLITPNSINSVYVLFELGARWGARQTHYPSTRLQHKTTSSRRPSQRHPNPRLLQRKQCPHAH